MVWRNAKAQHNFDKLRSVIYDYVKNNPGCSQAEFCAKHGLLPNCVSGRFTELVDEGFLIISGKKFEPLMGRVVNAYTTFI
jgi:predicted transcriptional regulator